TAKQGLSSSWIVSVHADSEGHIWAGSRSGVDRYDSASDSFRTVQSGDSVQAICSDREGSLWLGYGHDGLARFRQGLFLTYTPADGLGDDLAPTAFQDRKGNIWIGTAQGLSLYKGDRLVTYAPKGLKNRRI